jgi:hypothetical protein
LIEVEFTNNNLKDFIYWNTSERTASTWFTLGFIEPYGSPFAEIKSNGNNH